MTGPWWEWLLNDIVQAVVFGIAFGMTWYWLKRVWP